MSNLLSRREFLAAIPALALAACPPFKGEPVREVVEKKTLDIRIEWASQVRFLYVGLVKGVGPAPRLSSTSCHEDKQKNVTCQYYPEVESDFDYSLFIFEEGVDGNNLIIKLSSQEIQSNTFPKLIKVGKDKKGKLIRL